MLTTSYITASGNKVTSQVDAKTGKKTQLEALSLVNNFDAEVSKLTETDVNTLYDRVTELIYKYLYYINPATNSKDADAGLWDHSSTTAGIGNCMYVNLEESDKYKKSDVYMLKVEMQDSGFESLSEYTKVIKANTLFGAFCTAVNGDSKMMDEVTFSDFIHQKNTGSDIVSQKVYIDRSFQGNNKVWSKKVSWEGGYFLAATTLSKDKFTDVCNTKPIEVPIALRKDKYLKLGRDITDTENKFIKDADKLKSWNR